MVLELAKLRHSVSRQVEFLWRLTRRMEARGFPRSDRVQANAIRARKAMEALLNSIPAKSIRDAYPPFKDPPDPDRWRKC